MAKHEDTKINFLGNVLIIVLFFIFVSSFSNKPEQIQGKHYQLQLASEIHANSAAINEPHFLPILSQNIAVIDLLQIKNNTLLFKVLNFNSNNQQLYSFFKLKEITIRPSILHQIVYIGRVTKTETPLVLS